MSRIGVIACVLLCSAFGVASAQVQWQELAAAKLNQAERGTTEYLNAILERTAAMLNHDKEQAIEFAELALKEARRQNNPSAEAICYLQRSIAIAEMEGLRASEQAYQRAVALFDPKCSPELRLFYYSHLFYRDRLLKSPGELLAISQKMRNAIDQLDDQKLKLLGELSLYEQRAIAAPPTKETSAPLREMAQQAGMEFIELSLDCQEVIKADRLPAKEALEKIAPLAERAKVAQFRPVHILLLMHLIDAAAQLQDLDKFEQFSDDLYESAGKLKLTDWVALSLCAKADLALARKNTAEALARMDEACELLPAIDMGNVRRRVQKAAVKVYLATGNKQRLVDFTNSMFASDDHIQSRKLQQRLLEFSRQLDVAQEAAAAGAQRVEELKSEQAKLVVLNENLIEDRATVESEKSVFQKLTTVGFLLTTLLAALTLVSRQRLKRTHAELQAEVEANKKSRQLQKTMEVKIAQAERMESLGALAGGIAHDLNNLLVGVLCNAELLESNKLGEQAAADCTTGIIASAMAAAELSQKMLSYAGRVPSCKRPDDLNEMIRNISPLLKSGLNLACDLLLDESEPLPAEIDHTQMEQVVMNLATNAATAIKHRENGRLVVRTGTEAIVDVASDPTLFGLRTDGGEFVFFEFEDNGDGIDEANLQRIFEPFYSTRDMGQGLGLAVVYGHVVSHDGLIRCTAVKGEGTRFRILLPRYSSDDAAVEAMDGTH